MAVRGYKKASDKQKLEEISASFTKNVKPSSASGSEIKIY